MPDRREAILKAKLAVEGDSPRRLGLLVSLAFRRFIRLYRKDIAAAIACMGYVHRGTGRAAFERA